MNPFDDNALVTAIGSGGIVSVLWAMVRTIDKVVRTLMAHMQAEKKHWGRTERLLRVAIRSQGGRVPPDADTQPIALDGADDEDEDAA